MLEEKISGIKSKLRLAGTMYIAATVLSLGGMTLGCEEEDRESCFGEYCNCSDYCSNSGRDYSCTKPEGSSNDECSCSCVGPIDKN